MIRINLITDIRPGIPFSGEGRFRFLGMTPEGFALLSFGGKLVQARVEGNASRLPAPGEWLRATIQKDGETIRLAQIERHSTPEQDRLPGVPKDILGVLAELMHPEELARAEQARLDAFPMSDFLLVPGTLRDGHKRARLRSGHGKTKSGPWYLMVRTSWPTLGEIGLLFFADNAEFRNAQVVITARDSDLRSRIEKELSGLDVRAQVVLAGEAIVDRSA